MQATAESSAARAGPVRGNAFQLAARRAGCALMFGIFGIGALGLVLLVVPLARLAELRTPRDRIAQRWIQRAFRTFTAIGDRLGLFALEVRCAERLARGPALVVANHPTLLDVVFLISRLPQADCVVKAGAWRNPFLRGMLSVAGYVSNGDGAELVAECAGRLRAGRTLVLFPEGSRSTALGMRRFRRGAARIALTSGCAVRPVHIRCEPRILGKDQSWWTLPGEKVRYTLRVGEDIALDRLAADLPQALAARRVTEELERVFESGVLPDVA